MKMPLVTINTFKGASTPEQRAELIVRVSDVVAEWVAGMGFEKANVLPHVWCIIEEVEFGNWGVGGRAITPELLKATLEGKLE